MKFILRFFNVAVVVVVTFTTVKFDETTREKATQNA